MQETQARRSRRWVSMNTLYDPKWFPRLCPFFITAICIITFTFALYWLAVPNRMSTKHLDFDFYMNHLCARVTKRDLSTCAFIEAILKSTQGHKRPGAQDLPCSLLGIVFAGTLLFSVPLSSRDKFRNPPKVLIPHLSNSFASQNNNC